MFSAVVLESLEDLGYRDLEVKDTPTGHVVAGVRGWRIEVVEGSSSLATVARRFVAAATEGADRRHLAVVWASAASRDEIEPYVFISHDDLMDSLDEIVKSGLVLADAEREWIRSLGDRGTASYRVKDDYVICRTRLPFSEWLLVMSRWRWWGQREARAKFLHIVPAHDRKGHATVNKRIDWSVYRAAEVERETDEQLARYGSPLVGSNMTAQEYLLLTTPDMEIDEGEEIDLEDLAALLRGAATCTVDDTGGGNDDTGGGSGTTRTRSRG